MIILEKPFVSNEIKDFLEHSQTAVLDNATARESAGASRKFNLVSDQEARKRIASGERIYTVSENALDWIYQNSSDKNLLATIDTMKNKAAMRRLLKSVYPKFFFEDVPAKKLREIRFSDLPVPVVLKPAIGFFSVGVYTIRTQEDWENAISEIEKNSSDWGKLYPDSVLGNASFIIEKYINGDEFAVDVYFDEQGKAVLLNILKHDFASERDVSDRLYYTSKKIIKENLQRFTDFFNRVNGALGAKNFPAHVELRVENGQIVPIEFNPMRFAGWCCTDVALFAFGIRTYEYFLENKKPEWEKILSKTGDEIFTMLVLNKPEPCPPIGAFDYDALCAKFECVLCLRQMDFHSLSVFGFLYTKTRKAEELAFIVHSDLTEFIHA